MRRSGQKARALHTQSLHIGVQVVGVDGIGARMAGHSREGMLFFVVIADGASLDRAICYAVYQLSQRHALEGQSIIAAHRAELAVFGSWVRGPYEQCDGAGYWADI